MKYTVYYRVKIGLTSTPSVISPEHYEEVGTVEAENLGHLFRIMNVVDGSEFEMPRKLGCRSMSVGDVAVDGAGTNHYCDSIGWAKVTWA